MKFFFAVMGGNLAAQDRKTSREQRGALFQSSKRNADSSGSLNRCVIQYEVSVCASHLPKHSHFVLATAGETFNSDYFSQCARERLPIIKFSPGLFQKAAYPAYPISSRAVLFAAREDVRGAFGSEEDNGGGEGHYPREGDNAAVDEA